MTDYYSVLSRAVAQLDSNTAAARAALFERARGILVHRIENDRERWTDEAASAEVANFDAATDRIEAEFASRTTHNLIGRHGRRQPADFRSAAAAEVAPDEPKRGLGRGAMLGAGALALLLVAGAAVYALRGGRTSTPPATQTKADGGSGSASAPEAKKIASSRPSLDGDDLEPGVDGGSTDAGLPYYLRRQAVYYRSVYSSGMIVVDRSQRFLYLIQPQSRALRYGIGVGGECDIAPGLYRIKSKSPHWPDWSPSPELLKRHSYPAKVPGGPGNPLGAYVLYFESSLPGIHGTNAPKSIGQAPTLGCFRLVNDDVADLEGRVAIGTGVVVLN